MLRNSFQIGDVLMAKRYFTYMASPWSIGHGDIFIVVNLTQSEDGINVDLLGTNNLITWAASWGSIDHYFCYASKEDIK